MSKRPKKSSWIVRMERVVLTDVVVEGCTEEEARIDPFTFSIDENEVDMMDYTVRSVEENV